jgi:hypothetical protein
MHDREYYYNNRSKILNTKKAKYHAANPNAKTMPIRIKQPTVLDKPYIEWSQEDLYLITHKRGVK